MNLTGAYAVCIVCIQVTSSKWGEPQATIYQVPYGNTWSTLSALGKLKSTSNGQLPLSTIFFLSREIYPSHLLWWWLNLADAGSGHCISAQDRLVDSDLVSLLCSMDLSLFFTASSLRASQWPKNWKMGYMPLNCLQLESEESSAPVSVPARSKMPQLYCTKTKQNTTATQKQINLTSGVHSLSKKINKNI